MLTSTTWFVLGDPTTILATWCDLRGCTGLLCRLQIKGGDSECQHQRRHACNQSRGPSLAPSHQQALSSTPCTSGTQHSHQLQGTVSVEKTSHTPLHCCLPATRHKEQAQLMHGTRKLDSTTLSLNSSGSARVGKNDTAGMRCNQHNTNHNTTQHNNRTGVLKAPRAFADMLVVFVCVHADDHTHRPDAAGDASGSQEATRMCSRAACAHAQTVSCLSMCATPARPCEHPSPHRWKYPMCDVRHTAHCDSLLAVLNLSAHTHNTFIP